MELRTQRLLLRDFHLDDVFRVQAYQSRPAYLRHYDGEPPTPEETRAFVGMLREWAEEAPRTRYQLAITLDGVLIGTCGVRQETPGDAEAEFGCELDPDHWGHGYAREASRAILAFGFEALGLRRIVAHTLAENDAAVRLAEDLGFRRLGDGHYGLERDG